MAFIDVHAFALVDARAALISEDMDPMFALGSLPCKIYLRGKVDDFYIGFEVQDGEVDLMRSLTIQIKCGEYVEARTLGFPMHEVKCCCLPFSKKRSEYVQLAKNRNEFIIEYNIGCRIHFNVSPCLSKCSLDFESLLKSGIGSDIVFDVRGTYFNLHKVILAARVPMMRAMLFGSFAESNSTIIKFDMISPEVFKVVTHFIYSGTIERDIDVCGSDLMVDILRASSRLGMVDLCAFCQSILEKVLSYANVLPLLAVSCECEDFAMLREATIKFIKRFGLATTYQISPDLMRIIKEHCADDRELCAFIESKVVVADTEIDEST